MNILFLKLWLNQLDFKVHRNWAYANQCREHHGDHWVTGCGWCAGEICCGCRGVVDWGWRGVGGFVLVMDED